MHEFYTFAGDHPWLTFFLAWLLYLTITLSIKYARGAKECDCERRNKNDDVS